MTGAFPSFYLLQFGSRLSPGLLHLHGMLSLIWDERPIKFESQDEEEMWRLFYRRSGMGRLEFKHALKLGK